MSWEEAMIRAGERYRVREAKQQVRGWRVPTGWEYVVSEKYCPPPLRPLTEPPFMTREWFDVTMAGLKNCAQRARQAHGGEPKKAIPSEELAGDLARYTGAKFYRCPLPAPAIGPHWHLFTSPKRKIKRRK